MKHFNQRKVVKFLQVLNEEEFKSYGKWLKSSWHTSNKKLHQLYKLIYPYYPAFEHSSLEIHLLFDKLFPKKEWDPKSFNNLIAEFRKQVDRFMTNQYLEQRPNLQKELLMQDYLERQENKAFTKMAQQLIKGHQTMTAPSEEDFLQVSCLQDLIYFQPSDEKRYQAEEEILRQANQSLDQFYLLRKFRYLHEYRQRKLILESSEEATFNNSLMQKLAKDYDLPALKLYQFCTDDQRLKGREGIEKFRQLFFAYFDQLALQEQKIFFRTCTNETIKLSTNGDLKSFRDLFELYCFGLTKGILLHKGQVTGTTYTNYVLVGTLLNENQAVNEFIEKYAKTLPQELHQDATNWSIAQLMYSQGIYRNCIQQITQYSFKSKVYEIQARVTLSKAYFDLLGKDSSIRKSFMSSSKSFEKYMQRSKLYSTRGKEACLKWIRYTRALANINQDKDQDQQIKKIQDQLSKDHNVYGQWWLNQKIKELKEKGDPTLW